MSSIKKSPKGDRRKYWQKMLTAWKQSGWPVRRFCRKKGLSEASFYSWRKKLTAAKRSSSQTLRPTPSSRRSSRRSSAPRFIEVALSKDSPPTVELLLSSGHTLKFSPSLDRQALHQILSTFQELKLC